MYSRAKDYHAGIVAQESSVSVCSYRNGSHMHPLANVSIYVGQLHVGIRQCAAGQVDKHLSWVIISSIASQKFPPQISG
jgi:hypothetical protein